MRSASANVKHIRVAINVTQIFLMSHKIKGTWVETMNRLRYVEKERKNWFNFGWKNPHKQKKINYVTSNERRQQRTKRRNIFRFAL